MKTKRRTRTISAISTKRRRINREASEVREQFARDFPGCMVCLRAADDTHEISRGPARAKSLGNRAALLRLCRTCHDEIHERWSIQAQYALKAFMDPEHFDRVGLNHLRGRAGDAINEREVWQAFQFVIGRVTLRR